MLPIKGDYNLIVFKKASSSSSSCNSTNQDVCRMDPCVPPSRRYFGPQIVPWNRAFRLQRIQQESLGLSWVRACKAVSSLIRWPVRAFWSEDENKATLFNGRLKLGRVTGHDVWIHTRMNLTTRHKAYTRVAHQRIHELFSNLKNTIESYTPGRSTAGTYKSPNWKGKPSSKPPWLRSMLIFRGKSSTLVFQLRVSKICSVLRSPYLYQRLGTTTCCSPAYPVDTRVLLPLEFVYCHESSRLNMTRVKKGHLKPPVAALKQK